MAIFARKTRKIALQTIFFTKKKINLEDRERSKTFSVGSNPTTPAILDKQKESSSPFILL